VNQITVYSQNRLDKFCAIELPNGGSGSANLYDNDPATIYQSSGSNDSTTENVRFIFKDAAGNAVGRDFDSVILLNTNVKSLTAAYYDPIYQGYKVLSLSPASLSASNGILACSPDENPTAVVLNLQTTQTADQEKKIGEVKLVKKLLTLDALSSFKRKDDAKSGSMRMADGSLVAWSEYQKPEGTLTLQNVSQSDRDALLSAIADNDFLTFVFFADYDPSQIYEFFVSEPPTETFDRKTKLYEMELSLKGR